MELTEKESWGKKLLRQATSEYDPVAVFGMFSGGHDSLCATHMVSKLPGFVAAVHINTGIGIEQTREFVRNTCKQQDWPLIEIRAKEDMGQDYEQLVLEYGFPGPFHHRKMYNRLKERAIRKLIRDYKTKWSDKILLVTGVRKEESIRRMATTEAINRIGAQVWVAPLTNFTSMDKNAYIEKYNLTRNEVVDILHMSGECLCGAFAKPGELEEIAVWFPETALYIRKIEEKAKAAGVPCTWGIRPYRGKKNKEQIDFFEPLCVGCRK